MAASLPSAHNCHFYLYQKILVPGAAVKSAPADAALTAVTDSAADLQAKLAAIDVLPKPMPETPDYYWASHRAAEKQKLKDTWRNRDAVRALVDGEEGVFEGGGGERDPFAPLLDGLRAEMVQYKESLLGQTDLAAEQGHGGEDFPCPPYGTPLGPKVDRAVSSGRSARGCDHCFSSVPLNCLLAPRPPPAAMSVRTLSLDTFALSCGAPCFPAPFSSSRWPTTTSDER